VLIWIEYKKNELTCDAALLSVLGDGTDFSAAADWPSKKNFFF